MKWSTRIGRLAGIDVYMHWTFLLLLAWVVMVHMLQGETLPVALRGVGFVLAIFACIVLHELGHALAARRYGIRTRDITLLPIGGLARLERMPEEPLQELWVALAGPAVNVLIAGALFGLLISVDGIRALTDVAVVGGDFLAKLMYVNIILVVFNMLPAFPMDGGRALRALLARKMDYVAATQIAANVGQGMAIVFGIFGVFFNWFLLFIAIFVYLGAQQEAHMVQMRSFLQGVPARQAMITRFRTFSKDAPLETVIEEMVSGEQHDFPVVDDDRIVGILTRDDLLAALAAGRRDVRVAEVMRRDCATIEEGDMLDATFARMQEANCPALPVVRDGQVVGIVNLTNISEWMMIQSARRRARTHSEVEE